MELQITCPYCGKIMNLTQISAKVDVVCELCGSPLNEEVKAAMKNYKPPQNVGDRRYASNQYHEGMINVAQVQNVPFPKSGAAAMPSTPPVIAPQGKSPLSPRSPPVNGGLLVFPQINKQITVEPNLDVFFFGRNTILPLINPNDYDIEWLNSISRVRKDAYNRIVHQHFKLAKDGTGHYTIEDSRSRWGTWVNRQQIKGRGPIPLSNGDKIELMLSKPNTKKIVPFEIYFYC
jgi:hypothetical protein